MKFKKTGTGNIILDIGKNIFKIPITLGAMKEALTEKKLLEQIEKDPFFSRYLIEYKYLGGFLKTKKLSLFKKEQSAEIAGYFKEAFKEKGVWPKRRLGEIMDSKIFLDFISKNMGVDYRFWKEFLNSNEMPSSSAHGDFHPDNIVLDHQKLFFIDWSHYRFVSSRYFDLIDYYILSKREGGTSWIDIWQNEIGSKDIYGIFVSKQFWNYYAVWKVVNDLHFLKKRGSFNEFKRIKYFNFISLLKKNLCIS
jgi:hypothetical protein